MESNRCHAARPGPAPVVRIGFIALADCAPLLAAEALGLFATQGVVVELSREVGWATIREKILYRQLDAAHAIAGLALSLRLGLDGTSCPAIAPFVFNLNGNAITLGMDLWRRGVRDAASLNKLVRSTPQRLFTFGIVARSSSHHFLMRKWLATSGIDPDRDVRIVVLPPTQMAGSLRAGLIDGYCVGEPWNSAAVVNGSGWCPALSCDLASDHPEKVLLTTESFAEDHPGALSRVIRALHAACAWCDKKENRSRLVDLLLSSGHFHVERDVLSPSLVGPFDDGAGRSRDSTDFHVFHRRNANEPTPAKGEWLLREFLTNGLVEPAFEADARDALRDCWRPDLFHRALASPPSGKRRRSPASYNPNLHETTSTHQPFDSPTQPPHASQAYSTDPGNLHQQRASGTSRQERRHRAAQAG